MLTKLNWCVILTKKVEAHLENSIRRAKVGADVAAEKGSGAEGRSERAVDAGDADKIRLAVAFLRRAILFSVCRARKGSRVTAIFIFRCIGNLGRAHPCSAFLRSSKLMKKRYTKHEKDDFYRCSDCDCHSIQE